jgi:hypothetical protein
VFFSASIKRVYPRAQRRKSFPDILFFMRQTRQRKTKTEARRTHMFEAAKSLFNLVSNSTIGVRQEYLRVF